MDKMTNNNHYLPEPLHSILIGLMLGDGYIYKSSFTSNSRLEFSFGESYKEYGKHIENLFQPFIKTPLKEVTIQGSTKSYINYRLKTRSLPVFNNYHSSFYQYDSFKYIKIVPSNIKDLLTDIALAYLVMSDGNYQASRNRIRIYTNSFSKDEVTLLSSAINDNFNIKSAIMKDKKDQWIITIGANYLPVFRELVKPHMFKSMLYRIGL